MNDRDNEWRVFKLEYASYITNVVNKKFNTETITFWNGYAISKYNFKYHKKYIIKRIQQPIRLVNYKGDFLGYEWPLKSKVKFK